MAQIGFGAHLDTLPWAISRGINQQGVEVDHSSPYITEAANGGALSLFPWRSAKLSKGPNVFVFVYMYVWPNYDFNLCTECCL